MEWAWLAPALCILAFVLVAFWGRYLPGKGAYISIGAIGLGFVVFVFVARDLLSRGPADFSVTWFAVGQYDLRLGMTVDQLSVLMLGVVTFIATLIQIYSMGYMHGDPRYSWYFAAHSLFAAAMLGLVLADNFLLLYIAWELVGLCSYLLIGFWFERPSAREAAKKAFVTTRLGDVGLLIGILILFRVTGSFDMKHIFEVVEHGAVSSGLLTLAAILIFLGAMGKSAQFPFHVWLPDAMEGPTPVSALIHAATMVAAGVYLVARVYPLFVAAPGALQFIAIIGLITALLAATMALVMTDIKRVLAYSTVSHLGFMMLGLGSLGFTAGIFHLAMHAFSKALLFLGAGSVIHSTDRQEISEMGGLWRKMPLTALTFIAGSLSLAGIPPLAGFWSKDEILGVVFKNQPWWIFALAVIGAFMSALYMSRLIFLVFFGEPRDRTIHAHESPKVMTIPLLILSLFAVLAGLTALNWVGPALGLAEPYIGGFGSFIFFEEPELYHANLPLLAFSIVVALLGFGTGWAIYGAGWLSPAAIARGFGPLFQLVRSKYYLDDLYQAIIDRVVLVFSGMIALFDRAVVNDRGVNGTAQITAWAGLVLRYHETGRLYNYGLAMAIGVSLIIIVAAPFIL